MLVLAAGPPRSFAERFGCGPYAGYLLTPRHLHWVERVLESGLPWGVDYRSVRGEELDRYRVLVKRISGRTENCRFVMAPPEMGARFWSGPWERLCPFVLEGSLPLLPQQGAEILQVKRAGLWVHARDVLGYARAVAFARAGADSISPPHYGRFTYRRFEPLWRAARDAAGERSLFGSEAPLGG